MLQRPHGFPTNGAEHFTPTLRAGHLGWPGAWPGSAGDRSTARGSWVSSSATWLHPNPSEGRPGSARKGPLRHHRAGGRRAGGQNGGGPVLGGGVERPGGWGGRGCGGAADAEPGSAGPQLGPSEEKPARRRRETVRKEPLATADNSCRASGEPVPAPGCTSPGPGTRKPPQPRQQRQAPEVPGAPRGPPTPRAESSLYVCGPGLRRCHQGPQETTGESKCIVKAVLDRGLSAQKKTQQFRDFPGCSKRLISIAGINSGQFPGVVTPRS